MSMEYTIVVPSRRRAQNMVRIRSLLPTALVCVDETEAAEYGLIVPKANLLVHPPLSGFAAVMNWMQDAVKSDVLIELDDDFQSVQVATGSYRTVRDPVEILGVLENAARCCAELGLSTFCFGRVRNPRIAMSSGLPIVPRALVTNVFGIMGAARHRRFNEAFVGRTAVDWTLETLLHDRAVYCDQRFYFDCGQVFGGGGGNTGLVTSDAFNQSTSLLQKKWGRLLSFNRLGSEKDRLSAPVHMAGSFPSYSAMRLWPLPHTMPSGSVSESDGRIALM